MKKILFIIPARAGSTRIKNKNLKKIKNNSLLKIKIKNCKSTRLGEIIVSTDSQKIKKIAINNGAKVPIFRPKKYSLNHSAMITSVLHILKYFKTNKLYIPKYIAVMPPTFPFLKARSILTAFKKIKKNPQINSLCAYTENYEHPFLIVEKKQKLKFNTISINKKTLKDVERSQEFPKVYTSSGAIRISKTKYFLDILKKKLINNREHVIDYNSCLGVKITKIESYDINNYNDLKKAKLISKYKNFFIN